MDVQDSMIFPGSSEALLWGLGALAGAPLGLCTLHSFVSVSKISGDS